VQCPLPEGLAYSLALRWLASLQVTCLVPRHWRAEYCSSVKSPLTLTCLTAEAEHAQPEPRGRRRGNAIGAEQRGPCARPAAARSRTARAKSGRLGRRRRRRPRPVGPAADARAAAIRVGPQTGGTAGRGGRRTWKDAVRWAAAGDFYDL
jgi:hypothetical protein